MNEIDRIKQLAGIKITESVNSTEVDIESCEMEEGIDDFDDGYDNNSHALTTGSRIASRPDTDEFSHIAKGGRPAPISASGKAIQVGQIVKFGSETYEVIEVGNMWDPMSVTVIGNQGERHTFNNTEKLRIVKDALPSDDLEEGRTVALSKRDANKIAKRVDNERWERHRSNSDNDKPQPEKKPAEKEKEAVGETIELGDPDFGLEQYYIVPNVGNQILAGPFDSAQEAQMAARTYIWFNPRQHSIEMGFDDGDGHFLDRDGNSVDEDLNIREFAPAGGPPNGPKGPNEPPRDYWGDNDDDDAPHPTDYLYLTRSYSDMTVNMYKSIGSKDPVYGINDPEDIQHYTELYSYKPKMDELARIFDESGIGAGLKYFLTLPPIVREYLSMAWEDHGLDWEEDCKKFGLDEDLNNGYDSTEYVDGNDYFPNGADSSVVDRVGPSGARQGDNPEQKRMEVAETHTELVYAYRNFLNESAKSDPCWDGYKQVGTKKKNKKTVPNCVPKK